MALFKFVLIDSLYFLELHEAYQRVSSSNLSDIWNVNHSKNRHRADINFKAIMRKAREEIQNSFA